LPSATIGSSSPPRSTGCGLVAAAGEQLWVLIEEVADPLAGCVFALEFDHRLDEPAERPGVRSRRDDALESVVGCIRLDVCRQFVPAVERRLVESVLVVLNRSNTSADTGPEPVGRPPARLDGVDDVTGELLDQPLFGDRVERAGIL